VPSLDWFVYAFVRKEAVISSQIEGTQASLDDLLAVEADARVAAPPEHVEEICNYLEALRYAEGQLNKKNGLPLSVRLFNGAHKRLMAGTRGRDQQPGKIRRSQNWIGGTRPGNARFVPPPPHYVADLLGDLERWLNSDETTPPLVRAGLAHAQFETIHPYLDGNGRLGRLLITLCLQEWKQLSEPLRSRQSRFARPRNPRRPRPSVLFVMRAFCGKSAVGVVTESTNTASTSARVRHQGRQIMSPLRCRFSVLDVTSWTLVSAF
jgi:Fic family protein